MIDVRVLNGVTVHCDGAEITLQPKRLLLLLYLLLEARDTPVRRDQLLVLFWPETESERARNALRQALFALRTALGADVIVARGTTELMVDLSAVRCDVLTLIDAASRADHAAVDALFRTDFLAAVDAGESTELERWVEETRVRIRRITAMALRALAETPGLPAAQRLVHLERLLMLTPYDEHAAMTLVSAHLSAGRRADAVETYRRFAARLREDLEIEPSDAFVQLIGSARVGDGVPVASAPALPRPAAEPVPPRPQVAWRWVAGAALVAVLLAGWLSFRAVAEPTLIAVVPFAHAAGGERLAQYSAERVRGLVADVPGFGVVGGADTDRPSLLRRQRPGTVVRGGVEQATDGNWRLWASVTAVESDMLLQRVEVQGTQPESLATALADRVAAVVATRREMELQWGRTLHRPTALRALELFLGAFQSVAAGDADDGIAKFEAAWAADSTFVFAGIMAATNANAIGARARADSLIAAVLRSPVALLPLETHQLGRVRAWARADVQAALNESRIIAGLEPTAPFLAAQYAEDAVLANRPREALAALDRIPGFSQGSESIDLGIRSRALHMLGRFEEELAAVDPVIERQPTASHLSVFRLAPLAALGRVDSLNVILGAAASREDGRDVGRLYRAVGLELLAHGHREAGRRVMQEGVRWVRRQPSVPALSLTRQLSAAELLLDAGELDEAAARVSALEASLPPNASLNQRSAIFAMRGVLAARQERSAEALAWSDSLKALSGAARFGVETYRRARIAGALGRADAAAVLLEQANQEGFITNREIHYDPAFDAVRRNASFRRVTAPRG